jgi:hypothetical protein
MDSRLRGNDEGKESMAKILIIIQDVPGTEKTTVELKSRPKIDLLGEEPLTNAQEIGCAIYLSVKEEIENAGKA